VEQSHHSYRTETHIIDQNDGGSALNSRTNAVVPLGRRASDNTSMANVSMHSALSSGQPFVVTDHGTAEQVRVPPLPPAQMALSSGQQFAIQEQSVGGVMLPNMPTESSTDYR
jgi:hypothetical protein